MTSLKTPVLFLIFNRPHATERVFNAIRKARPTQLFIAADGPRSDHLDDAEAIRKTRGIVAKIDWPCEVQTLYRTENLGSKKAVEEAITWFFSSVEEGIILEDDCLPDASFFRYCEELLERYRDDENIMMVGGFNLSPVRYSSDSYFFSRYAGIWGWATWRRAWKHYDGLLRDWDESAVRARIRATIGQEDAWRIKQWIFDRVHAGTKRSWGYAWEYAMLANGGLSAVPLVNLVENIGYGADATRTTNASASLSRPRLSLSLPLRHPETIVPNDQYDAYFIRTTFGSKAAHRRISEKVQRRFKQIIERLRRWPVTTELRRLKRLPRFVPGTTNLFGKPFRFVDAASFVAAYTEIVMTGIYSFVPTSSKPYILDCGANVGVSVLQLKQQYPDARIVAFEPDEHIVETLRRNIATFKLTDVTVVPKALWNEETTLSFSTEGADGGHLSRDAHDSDRKAVSTTRLGPYIDSRTVDFLKIDIEGAETAVLLDIEPRLHRVRNLFVEYHSPTTEPQTLHELLRVLARAGFRYHIQSAGMRPPQPFMIGALSKHGYDNLLNIFAYRL